MSFLFEKRTGKVMKWVGGFFAILIIISMIVLYSPGLIPSGGSHGAPVSQA